MPNNYRFIPCWWSQHTSHDLKTLFDRLYNVVQSEAVVIHNKLYNKFLHMLSGVTQNYSLEGE